MTLPTDTVDDYFGAKLYTGNATSTQDVTGYGFKPDFVWQKRRSTAGNHFFVDSLRGVDKFLSSDNSGAQGTGGGAQAFISDGFTTTNDNNGNKNGQTYVAWAWKAGGAPTATNSGGASPTSGSVMVDGSAYGGSLSGTIHVKKLSVNTESGFAIGTYDATGSASTIDTLLGAAPDVIFVKAMQASNSWMVFHSSLGTGKQFLLNSTGGSSTDAHVSKIYSDHADRWIKPTIYF